MRHDWWNSYSWHEQYQTIRISIRICEGIIMEYRLEEIFDLQMGKTPSRSNPDYWNTCENKWISIADLSKCGKYIENTKEYLSDQAVEESGINQIPENTVIMSFKLSIGKTAITSEPMYSNEAIMSFRDKKMVDILPDYIFYMFLSRNWDEGTNKAVMGKTLNKATLSKIKITLPDIKMQKMVVDILDKVSDIIANRKVELEKLDNLILNKATLSKIKITLPDIKMQKMVVDILDKVSDIIANRKVELEKLDNLIKARFIELFGDPISNPNDWEIVPLGKRCEIVTGNTPSRSEPENYGEYIEWIKSDNINTPSTFITKAQECLSEIGFKKCRFVEAGSLLMTCIAGSINCIGNVAVTDRRVAFNQQINAIVPKQDKVLYLYWLMLLSKPAIHSTINMALKGILSKRQLAEMAFPFPPIVLQEQFAAFVKQTDKSKVVVQKALDQTQLLFDSLMQEYFG